MTARAFSVMAAVDAPVEDDVCKKGPLQKKVSALKWDKVIVSMSSEVAEHLKACTINKYMHHK